MSPREIHRAAMSGDIDELRRLLEAGADPNAPGITGVTALFHAVMKGDEASVRLLLAHGADPNRAGSGVPGPLSDTSNGVRLVPLVTVVMRGHVSIARLLLEAGADPNASTGEVTALLAAATRREPELLMLLLESGACPSPGQGRKVAMVLRDQPELAARVLALDEADLCAPAEEGDLERLRSRLAQGVDPNQPDARGTQPLVAAAREGQAEAVKLLLDAGAQLGDGANARDSPLVAAIGSRSAETVRLLLERGADSKECDTSYSNALTQAVLAGPEIYTLFTERGIALTTHHQAMLGNRDAVLQALEAGLSVDAHDESGLPLLHAAARSGSTALAGELLDRGGDPAVRDAHGNPVLSAAVLGGSTELLELLLTRDSAAGQPSLDHAFQVAAYRGDRPLATLLRARGADPNGGGPLDALRPAIMLGDAERLRWLLELGASPEGGAEGTISPVHSAILYGQAECLRVLIEAGADVNASFAGGQFPLEAVRLSGRPEMEAMLLAAGATEPPPSLHPGREKAMAAVREWMEELSSEDRRGLS